MVVSGTTAGAGGHYFNFIIQSGSNLVVFDSGTYTGITVPSNIFVSPTNFSVIAVSDSGSAIGYDGTGNAVVWTGTATGIKQLAPMEAVTAINNVGQVVGSTGTNGYLWTGATTDCVCPWVVSGTSQPISTLLPPPFQNEIANIAPIDISGTNAIDGSVRILFNALYQSGSDASEEPGGTGWSSGTFLLTLTSGSSPILSGTGVSTSGTAPTILQQVIVPSNVSFQNGLSDSMINSQGVIGSLGMTTGTLPAFESSGTTAIILLPVTLTNQADPTVRNGASGIDALTSFIQSNSPNIDNVAWIAASDTTQTAVVNGVYPPRMPNFIASSGSISGLTYNWRLQVTFHDRFGNPHRDFDSGDPNCSNTNAQIMTDPIVNPSAYTSDTPDQVNIPVVSGSWRQISGNLPWNMYQDSSWTAAVTGTDGFFGGDAILSLEILSGTNVISPEQDYDFRIAGENPSKAEAEAFLTGTYGGKSASQALVSNPHAWFAWAIAKDETAGEGSSGYYNHFMDNGDQQVPGTHGHWRNTGNPWPGHEGRPNWNDDGTNASGVVDTKRQTGSGGYGLFQLTYQSRNTTGEPPDASYIEPRNWIWNWQADAVAFGTELAGHITQGETFAATLAANYPKNGALPPTPDGIFSGLDGIIVTEYNGMAGGQMVSPAQAKKKHIDSTWIPLNGNLKPSCWVPFGSGWHFLQNKETYEANVGAIIHKGN